MTKLLASSLVGALLVSALPSMARGGGGGGHVGMIVMTLVGVAASVGTTYFVYKQLKKQTSQTNQ